MKKKQKTAKQINSKIGKLYTHMRFVVGYLKKTGKQANMNMGLVAMAKGIGVDASTRLAARTALEAFYNGTLKETGQTSPYYKEASKAFFESRDWLDLRYKTLKRYGRVCMCCGELEGIMQVDHIKPRSKYPELALDPDNLQVLCKNCNTGKSNKDETDWRP